MTTTITFPGKVAGLNGSGGLQRLHWSKKRELATSYDWIVRAATTYRHTGPVHFELVRYSTGQDMDYDNLVSTGKQISDSIVRAGVIVDDSPAVIVSRKYSQVKVKTAAEQCTVVALVDAE